VLKGRSGAKFGLFHHSARLAKQMEGQYKREGD